MNTMKRLGSVMCAIMLFLLASCASPPTVTPLPERNGVATPLPPTATLVATPAAVLAGPTQASTRLIPTIPSIASLPPAELVIEPAGEADSAEGEPVLYDIVLYNAQDVFGIQFSLSFDPSAVTVRDEDQDLTGIQIAPGEAFPRGTSFVALNRVDMVEGTLEFAATRVAPAETLSGRIVVASLALSLTDASQAELTFEEALLSDEAANSLPVAPQDLLLTTES